uniref:Uncharacterized protein n=1 Tax=Anguilla anguilla TaxID=7936 RepID=A0A0E9UA63_ANGAN
MKINARGKQDSLFITTRKITSKRLNSVMGNFISLHRRTWEALKVGIFP